MTKITLLIDGMHCASCSALLERDFNGTPGIANASVSIATNKAMLEYDENVITISDIEEIVKKDGFSVVKEATDQKKNKIKDMKKRFIISALFAVPLFLIAMLPMVGVDFIIDPMEKPVLFALLSFVLCVPVLFCGSHFFVNGFKQLFKLHPNMDTLIAIGTSTSFLYSVYGLLRILFGDTMFVHNLYFESSAVIITLVMLGKMLEERSKGKTGEAVKALMDLSPKTAFLFKDNDVVEVPIESVNTGDIVVVKPGGSIPVDGVVEEGCAYINESMITGESMPVLKSVGDVVTGATICQSDYIKVKATKVGADTTLSRIIKMVEDAQGSKAPIAKLADKVSLVFVPTVIAIALLSFYTWFILTLDFSFAFEIFVSVMVIACPCSLGLATPTAIMVGTGKAAKNGILFKNAESLEIASKATAVVFDKTGTLTKGTPVVTDVIFTDIPEEELIKITASVEKYSEHPLGKAIVSFAKEKNITLDEATDVKTVPGLGVCGTVNGNVIRAGNISFTKAVENDVTKRLLKEGKTLIYVTSNDELKGIFALSDVIKPESVEAIKMLHQKGLRTIMLTGDNSVAAKEIAAKLGINSVYAQVMPEEKADYVKKIMNYGQKVIMVGDGINDAPALAQADVGIAIGNGTDIAIESADVVLVKNDITDVSNAVTISRKVIRNIKQNLFWAFLYNCLGIPVAAGVLFVFGGPLLNPMIAAAAMSLSSVSVVTNALRLNRIKLK